MSATLLLLCLVVSGCLNDTGESKNGPTTGETPPDDITQYAFSDCSYQETLFVVTASDAKSLLPPGYVPVNGITGDDESAIIFIPYNGCAEKWVMVGITIKPPDDVSKSQGLNGYLLGSFVEDDTNNVSQLLPGRIEMATISKFESFPTSRVEVEGRLTMSAAHAVRNEIVSSSPFSIRLFGENDGERSTTILTASDLEREHSVGTFDADSIFGHQLPTSAPVSFVGTISDLAIERIE